MTLHLIFDILLPPLVKAFTNRRANLKTDLEILALIPTDHRLYSQVKQHTDKSIENLFPPLSDKTEREFLVYNWPRLIVGFSVLVIFARWTSHLIDTDSSLWLTIPVGMMAYIGSINFGYAFAEEADDEYVGTTRLVCWIDGDKPGESHAG